MPPRSNPKGVVFFGLLLLHLVGALQQQPRNAYPSRAGSDELSDRAAAAAERRWPSDAAAGADSLHSPLSGQRGFRDTHIDPSRPPSNQRALATLSPAEHNPAVRAPPAPRSSAPTAGISSRLPARLLQDWQVEDIILLATVDGRIHARDRKTGAPKWELATETPMVETWYHRNTSNDNNDDDDDGGGGGGGGSRQEAEDPLWIVEPSHGGSIYIYLPDSASGMKKLDFTVKELVELTPFDSQTDPSVTYTADKKTTLYTVDAATGNILKVFSAAGTFSNDDKSCRRVNPLEFLDDEECESIGTITLGRTEYTVGISNGNRQITTIRYFEWGPNNRDQDLRSKYQNTFDNKYVYTKYDGTIFGLDLGRGKDYEAIPSHKLTYTQAFTSPVVRVFDVVRHQEDVSSDASLVILPQPISPSVDAFGGPFEDVFVDCTENGSWFALSEMTYPGVTRGASEAELYSDEMFKFGLPSMAWPPSRRQRHKFTGIHRLSPPDTSAGRIIDPPSWKMIDPPPEESQIGGLLPAPESQWTLFSMPALLVTFLLVIAASATTYATTLRHLSAGKSVVEMEPPTLERLVLPVAKDLPAVEAPPTPKIRQLEPAKETIFPQDATKQVDLEPTPSPEEATEQHEANETAEGNEAKDGNEPKKKKATRGKRGGKKQKEKEQQQAEARAKNNALQVPEPVEVISVADSESPQVSGPLQINSLIIHTDKVIGQGSCGTSVFEGSFEGRAVAVKRMLSQYYELASQEVSFLQQSDDHPNVIRYFCQQRDDHFLYIAVELCQASLYEVWEAERAKTAERQGELQSLKLTIQQDVPRALQQLAAGLYHLHNLRIIHRDIKPQNILVAFPKRAQSNGPRLVISDFGLGKNLPENVSTLIDPTGNAGTSGWKAPELISQPKDADSRHSQSNSHTGGSEGPNGSMSGVKRAADIFSLGCLFFWVLTDGIHPYEDENGWQQLRELNIKRGQRKMDVLERWSDAYEPMQLITSMLEQQPEQRPTALQVLNHPFFWSPEKRLAFLCDCSDHFEREPRGVYEDYYAGDSAHLQILEDRAEEVIGGEYDRVDFLAKLDRHFVDTLGKQRKYSGGRLLDLLRALRNKKNHYEDMAEEVKKRVGPLPGGYLGFWTNRFPRLLIACYEVVHEVGLERSDRFKGYFALGVS